MRKTALITGITGQDGAYLAKFLIEKKYQVYGISRSKSDSNLWRLNYLNITDKIKFVHIDITDTTSVFAAIKSSKPEEIYHLAAYTSPILSLEHPIIYGEVNGMGVTNILEAIKCINPDIKLFIASTSELLNKNTCEPSLDTARFEPDNPYAIAKLYAFWMSRIYREGYNLFVCNGVFYNHESPLRGLDFVTRKITNEVARISMGLSKTLVLGNIEAKRDWGYAPDFVRAMWMMLQQEKPNDFVIAANEEHSVRDFLDAAFSQVNLNWQDFVKYDKALFRASNGRPLAINDSEIRTKLGWVPSVTFEQLVEIMVHEDLTRWKRHLNGEKFPWDINIQ